MILALAMLYAAPAEQCRQIHYLADGRMVVSTVAAPEGGNGVTAQTHARSDQPGGSSSSVSVSSSTSGNSSTSSASASSHAGGSGRRMSIKRDADGCTITIDDRPDQE